MVWRDNAHPADVNGTTSINAGPDEQKRATNSYLPAPETPAAFFQSITGQIVATKAGLAALIAAKLNYSNAATDKPYWRWRHEYGLCGQTRQFHLSSHPPPL